MRRDHAKGEQAEGMIEVVIDAGAVDRQHVGGKLVLEAVRAKSPQPHGEHHCQAAEQQENLGRLRHGLELQRVGDGGDAGLGAGVVVVAAGCARNAYAADHLPGRLYHQSAADRDHARQVAYAA